MKLCSSISLDLCTKDVTSQAVKKDVSSLRYIALPNWFQEAHMESSNSDAQDACIVDVLESSGIFNPTATSKIPPADQMESLTVESAIPTQASSSGTQTESTPVYDTDRSAENDNNVITEVTDVEQDGETVEQQSKIFEETQKSTVSLLLEEKKKLKSDFKTYEDELLDKQIQLEKKIKELNNILLKTSQSIQTIHMLSPKPDSFYHTEQKIALGYQNPFYLKQAQKKQQCLYDGKVLLEKHDPPVVHDSEETQQLTQESRDKMKQMNKEIKPGNYTKINHLSGFLFHKRPYLSDDTTPSVARKFINEVKSTIVTLQRVVKQRMTIEIHNWASSAHQELHKIVREEIFPIANQVDARVQNFEIQFLKEAAKFVGDFKSLANEADALLLSTRHWNWKLNVS
nr:hypothetical protein [Tanacetum cinerariifolium]